MKLFVGLGNPGPKYEITRHNAGFLLIDMIVEDLRASWEESKFQGDIAKADWEGHKCLFLKPMTFMNLSGKSFAGIMKFYKIPLEDLVVIYDDVDVPSGNVKARAGGGHGGHNGIRSIIDCTGSKDFHRIKLGVGRPEDNGRPGQPVDSWVLSKMTDEQLLCLQKEQLDAAKLRIKGIFDKSA